MKTTALVFAAFLGLTACETPQQDAALIGGTAGALIGGGIGNSVGSAIVGGAVGALAGAVLVQDNRRKGDCTYRYKGKYYREPCRR